MYLFILFIFFVSLYFKEAFYFLSLIVSAMITNRLSSGGNSRHRSIVSNSNWMLLILDQGFPSGSSGKEPTCQCRRRKRCRFDPWAGNVSWGRKWQPTPVCLPGKFRG